MVTNQSGAHGMPKNKNTPLSGNKIPEYETTGAASLRSSHSFVSLDPQLPSHASRCASSPRAIRNVPSDAMTKTHVHAAATKGTLLVRRPRVRSTSGRTFDVSHPPSVAGSQEHDREIVPTPPEPNAGLGGAPAHGPRGPQWNLQVRVDRLRKLQRLCHCVDVYVSVS